MTEKTLIKTLALPYGQEWAWYADSNVVVLSPCLDAEGRERALSEVQDYWRRSCLRVVGSDDDCGTRATQPLNIAQSPTLPKPTIRDIVGSL